MGNRKVTYARLLTPYRLLLKRREMVYLIGKIVYLMGKIEYKADFRGQKGVLLQTPTSSEQAWNTEK